MSEEPHVSGDQISDAAGPVPADISESSMAEDTQENQQVPLSALQAARRDKQRVQDDFKMYKDNVSLMMAQQQQQAIPQQQKTDEFEGMSKDDVPTFGDLEKMFSKREEKYAMTIQELRMTQKYPDYQEVVTKYLPEVLKTNPSLRGTLHDTKDFELAYYLAKNSDSFKEGHKKTARNADAERIVQNANKAGSLSSVGQTSPISQAKRWKDMSDKEFMQQAQKNLGHF